ncbi:MAG: hypothetical protein QM742_15025 [Aquabacterium sp.]
MPRCLTTVLAALAVTTASLCAPLPAHAQEIRPIPLKSLRGEAVFGQPPEVLLNGQPARLAPGARIKGTNNMLVMSGALVGQKMQVNYTVDTYGLLMDVWLLRPDEAAKPWPKTPQEAATWSWDPIAHAWIKP